MLKDEVNSELVGESAPKAMQGHTCAPHRTPLLGNIKVNRYRGTQNWIVLQQPNSGPAEVPGKQVTSFNKSRIRC